MRFQNGYGSITKLTGKRRKPWMVRVSNGMEYDEKIHDFKPKRIVLGYYATRKEANIALAEYNANPFNIEHNSLTFSHVYELFKKSNYYQRLGKSSISSRDAAYKYCKPLYDIKVKDITYDMLQAIIDACPHGSSTKNNIKTVMNSVFDHAGKLNIINKNPVQYIDIEYSEPVVDRIIFNSNEIKTLWSMSDDWDIKIILILLHTGMRVNELLKNYRENVNLNERWIYVPDEIAKNRESVRYVPIHDAIFDFVKYFYDNSVAFNQEKLVVNPAGTVVMYNNFVARNLKKINKHMDVPHKMHDTRHTFASLANHYQLEELMIQKIMGHKPSSILRSVYTHISVLEMLVAINNIKI